jgi:hypothetical protein
VKFKILFLFSAAFFLFSCVDDPIDLPEPPPEPDVHFAGIRSCYYGFGDNERGTRNFPTPDEAVAVMKNIAKKFGEETIPSAVWIIGGIITMHEFDNDCPHTNDSAFCRLEFPEDPESPTSDPLYIRFSNEDKHTPYLEKFDKEGIKVYLQVEPGNADMKELIRLCLNKYGHHSSVAGFGVDVEWYPSDGRTNGPDAGLQTPLDTNFLKEIDALVKNYNPQFKVMAKHFTQSYVGSKPVSDVIYIHSGQDYNNMKALVSQFANWANRFYPNEVGYQLGYPADYDWWKNLKDPMKEIGDAIFNEMNNKEQKINFFWVDFTIRWEKFDDLWK